MSAATAQKIRVLVIDDSSTVRIAASRIFGKEFDVLLAVDGEDGLEVIEKDPNVQVVFTDLVMPEMDGFELLRQVRTHKNEHINNVPVIVMTGAENPEVAKKKAFSLGATDFIAKPFAATDIRARARSYAELNLKTKHLKKQTTIDPLTGFLNKRGFKPQLEKDIALIGRHRHCMSAMAIEIDRYKNLFISMGRSKAEAIIKSIAKLISNSLRAEDTIARTGLARFTVTLPLTEKEHAMEIANSICSTIEAFVIKRDSKRLPLTVSTGVTYFEADDKISPELVVDMTHTALQKAAMLGQSQLYLYTLEMHYQDKQRQFAESVSIDSLLEKIHQGDDNDVAEQLNEALQKLAPLLSLLSNEQKQQLLDHR